jgi:hypothetical protein
MANGTTVPNISVVGEINPQQLNQLGSTITTTGTRFGSNTIFATSKVTHIPRMGWMVFTKIVPSGTLIVPSNYLS